MLYVQSLITVDSCLFAFVVCVNCSTVPTSLLNQKLDFFLKIVNYVHMDKIVYNVYMVEPSVLLAECGGAPVRMRHLALSCTI